MIKRFTILLILINSFLIYSQSTGNLSGIVKDASNGDALPGVNVILKGTYYGAATDINGKFKISNISVGSYNVDISLIGYKTVQYTGIQIETNKTIELDVKLEETVLTLDQDVIVIGEKPLMDVEETQSKKTITKEELDIAVIRKYK